jgi:hypothetical protein
MQDPFISNASFEEKNHRMILFFSCGNSQIHSKYSKTKWKVNGSLFSVNTKTIEKVPNHPVLAHSAPDRENMISTIQIGRNKSP